MGLSAIKKSDGRRSTAAVIIFFEQEAGRKVFQFVGEDFFFQSSSPKFASNEKNAVLRLSIPL